MAELSREQKLQKLEKLKQLKALKDQQAGRAQEAADIRGATAAEMSAPGAFAAGMGKGVARTGRGIQTLWNLAQQGAGFPQQEELAQLEEARAEEERLFAPLEEAHPIATKAGEIAGEIGAGAPVGFGTGSLVAKGVTQAGKKLAPKVAANIARYGAAGTGAGTEGLIIGAEEGDIPGMGATGAAIGLGAEAILPPAIKRLKRLFKAVPEGRLAQNIKTDATGKLQASPELEGALNEMGMTMDDISAEVAQDIAAGSPEEAARLALFEAEGITPSGRSRIAGTAPESVKAQQAESYLLRKTDDAAADEFRERVFTENQQMTQRFTQMADELGMPDPQAAGESIQQALQGQKSALRSERQAAYQTLGEMTAESGEDFSAFAVPKDRMTEALDDVLTYIPPEAEQSVARIMRKYGMTDMEAPMSPLEEIIGQRKAEPLSLKNLESFRSEISQALDVSIPKEARVRTRLIGEVDNILDDFVDASEDMAMPAAIAEQAKRARGLRRKEAVEFQAKDIVDSLTGAKKGTSTPMVDSAEVLGKLRGLKKEKEFEKMLTLLGRSDEGVEALGNLQAATVMDMLNSSLRPGQMLTGPTGQKMPAFSGTALTKALDKFGRRKLNRLFKNNPAAMNSLKRLEKIGERRTTGIEAVQKGSIPPAVLNKLMDSISKPLKYVPVVGETVGTGLAEKASASEGRRALKAAKDLRPRTEEIEDFVTFNAPRLAAVMGISVAAREPAREFTKEL